MKERPILFSGPMVRAILEGRKTQTRRVINPQPPKYIDELHGNDLRRRAPYRLEDDETGAVLGSGFQDDNGDLYKCPYGVPGNRLWVKHAASVFPVYFKPIVGWEGLYAAGTDGAIYRMDRGAPKVLKPSPNSKGYMTVSLSHGKWETHAVHRLICETFYGPPPSADAQVRHLDGDRSNSRPENLDWGTHTDNWQDRKGHGGGMGEQHHSAKLSEAAIAEIRASSLSQRALARKFGVSQATISDARLGKTWAQHAVGERNLPAFAFWRSPIHMPRWASRITLEVTGVRVERLQEISEQDAIAEGIEQSQFGGWKHYPHAGDSCACGDWNMPQNSFMSLWQSINGAGSWEANPWVWVIEFKRLEECP